ncbi:SpoIIE family protein phosphatase [Flammeovirga yaeyamensis]|uniref:SpoIIE family protein phosphatase n=1 Tax=Flammeovirga yaeyamensis TaxID=367791 RepID=A0AAX1NC67_9BACT|nr:SpoIIE family protein phosphatase [Flammeovirga yaeyamensis]MBB3696950.1 serine phosphatase RsbU (regulator of sigma subunit) [Flammeovirga yaeyamensis]NMF33613.1 SpoIIE family protein phosphatase [Flammeovirga yaeyamensis]QWG05119.1 SpoIIE family protein phosphatase [Flammeovirga yaeyamensis]
MNINSTITTTEKQQFLNQIKVLEERNAAQQQMMEMTVNYLNDANKELEKKKQEVEQVNEKMYQSIRYAKSIQSKMLLPDHQIKDIFDSHFIFYQPKDIVSGDFYWFYESTTYKYFAVIDCTGHGVPGAFMTVIINSILNDIVREFTGLLPHQILINLDERLFDYLNKDSSSKKNADGLDISLCSINMKTNKLHYCSTHQKIYHYKNVEQEVVELRGENYSIGQKTTRVFKLTSSELEYQQNDMIYLSSDGYLDQFGGKENQKFKRKNFKALLSKIAAFPIDNQSKVLEKVLEKWKGGRQQIDDILVMGIQL